MKKNNHLIKAIFLTQTSILGASARYRVYQFLGYLESNGINCTVSPAVSDNIFKKYHESLNIFTKTQFYTGLILKRITDLTRIKKFDVVFLQRDILIHLYPILEKIIALLNKKIIFDFDDALHLFPVNKNPGLLLNLLWDRRKIERIIKISKQVIAGNNFLKRYAEEFTKNVTVIPTSINLGLYKFNSVKNFTKEKTIIIGWIGSQVTFVYLERIFPIFEELAKRYKIELKVIGAKGRLSNTLQINYKDWNLNTEVEDIASFDIGIMPLTEDEWSEGKSATKLLQYMASGIPAIASPVGVNTEIIKDGMNGFLADTKEAWIKKISLLIENQQLRNEMVNNARSDVEKFYSVRVNGPKLLEVLKKATLSN